MRYDEITLPVANNTLEINFHPRVTVLAGLRAEARSSIIDAIASATSGATPGAIVALIDQSGRRSTIVDGQFDGGTGSLGTTTRIRNLLVVTSHDLGLPPPGDDLEHVRLQRQLVAARGNLDEVQTVLDKAQAVAQRRTEIEAELASVESDLAKEGSETDRYTLKRAKVLIEIEQLRATLDAIDAPSVQITRDNSLVESTVDVQLLADQWARGSEAIDTLKNRFGSQDRLGADQLADFVDIPATIPVTLANSVREHDQLLGTCNELQVTLDRALSEPTMATPADSRILVLATLDQESLWMSHRSVLLATEALQAATEEERQLSMRDPREREYIEKLHTKLHEAEQRAEKRWIAGLIVTTICACTALTLALVQLGTIAIPPLLAAALLSLGILAVRPRLAARQIRRDATNALEAVGASSLKEYLYRFSDDTDNDRWRRAEDLIADFEGAMEDWHFLVGDISPTDAGRLESQVHAWIEANDPSKDETSGTAVRRRLERVRSDLSQLVSHLAPLLASYDIRITRAPIMPELERRVKLGQVAKLQIELDEAIGHEEKVTRLLESQLEALGFESGKLAARIAAYGRELDAAIQRENLRHTAPERTQITARLDALEDFLAQPAPLPEATDQPSHRLTALRDRIDQLRFERDALEISDSTEIIRQRDAILNHVRDLEDMLEGESDFVVEHPVDQLVETLVRHRPIWPSTDHESSPAILDDPFASLEPVVQRRLLDALVEVAKMTQVILLTDDENVQRWAAAAQQRGEAALLAPGARNA